VLSISNRTIWALLALLLAVPVALAQQSPTDPVAYFLEEMEQEIASGDVQEGGPSNFSPGEPPELQGLEGIWGYTYWPDLTSAPYTWVRARATDSSGIAAWGHTTWSPVAPRRLDVYLHDESQPVPIQRDHAYYIKGLHWIPRNTPDFPPRNPPGSPSPPPPWAQGQVHSPTYRTRRPYVAGSLEQVDVCLSGEPRMW